MDRQKRIKSILMSIQPKYCELIANGKKTIEVRKTAPKFGAPFKVYIYCTKQKSSNVLMVSIDGKQVMIGDYRNACNCDIDSRPDWNIGEGKVIGEFVVDNVQEYDVSFWDGCEEELREIWCDIDDGERYADLIATTGESNYLCDKACLTWEELKKYCGEGDRTIYGLHFTVKNLRQAERVESV